MKRILLVIITIMLFSAQAILAEPDIRDLLKGLGNNSTSSTQDDNISKLGNVLGSVISNIAGGTEATPENLAGVYSYSKPAVTFASDNLLQKAGGAAMSAVIVNKLEPYYSKAGLNMLQVTLNSDKTFEFALGRLKLSGVYDRDSTATQGNVFVFNFQAIKKISIGRIKSYVQLNGSNLTLTFDASKLLSLANSIASLTGKQSLKTAAGLLNSYEGLNCGFELTRTVDTPVSQSSATEQTPADSSSVNSNTSGSGTALKGLFDALKKR